MKKSRIVEAPRYPGFRIELADDSIEHVSSMYRINQRFSWFNYHGKEAVAYDEENGEKVAELCMVEGKLKWNIYHRIPSWAEIKQQFDDALKQLNKATKAFGQTKVGKKSQAQRYQEIEDRERKRMEEDE